MQIHVLRQLSNSELFVKLNVIMIDHKLINPMEMGKIVLKVHAILFLLIY